MLFAVVGEQVEMKVEGVELNALRRQQLRDQSGRSCLMYPDTRHVVGLLD